MLFPHYLCYLKQNKPRIWKLCTSPKLHHSATVLMRFLSFLAGAFVGHGEPVCCLGQNLIWIQTIHLCKHYILSWNLLVLQFLKRECYYFRISLNHGHSGNNCVCLTEWHHAINHTSQVLMTMSDIQHFWLFVNDLVGLELTDSTSPGLSGTTGMCHRTWKKTLFNQCIV